MDGHVFSWVEENGDPSYPPLTGSKRKVRSKKMEFIGWGSKQLIEFLHSVGKDTTQLISRHDVTAIISRYVKENNLIHPVKKKRINCDERLHALFGRKSIARIKIHSMLEPHYAENLEKSDDELLYSSEENNNICSKSEQVKSLSSDRKTPSKKRALEAPKSYFAAIIPDNVKLVYLKRSLVQDLLKYPERFEHKIVGSFVRIKSDPNDYLQQNSHCLLQVTGIKKVAGADDTSTEIFFQVSNFIKDIPISFLSDDNFSEEECEDLRQRVKDGLLKKPTVVELEEKAQILHEDITKHWIVRELALLQKLINRANEKGWRREMVEYLERRQLLQTPAEQSRLLCEVPKVIADAIEQEALPHDSPDGIDQQNNSSQVPIHKETSEVPICDIAAHVTSSCVVSRNTGFTNTQAALPKSKQQTEPGIQAALAMLNQQTELEIQADLPMSKQQTELEIQVDLQKSKKQTEPEIEADLLKSKQQAEPENLLDMSMEKQQKLPTEIRNESNAVPQPVGNEENKMAEVIDLSDGDDDVGEDEIAILEIDVVSYEWYYVDPQGDTQGPFAITSLKHWSDADYFPPDFKIWKAGHSQDEAILLRDVLQFAYPNK